MKLVRSTKMLVAGCLLTILGIIGCVPALYYSWSHNGSVAGHALYGDNTVAKTVQTVISGHPVSISIPSLNINLSVINGYYNQKTSEWTLSLDKAQFATISTEPNNSSGNTFIYGHYRPEVFAYLHNIKPTEQAIITTDNNYQFIYSFVRTFATTPTDNSVFSYSGQPILTVQTCSGSWFQNRQMYIFNFVKYQKA